jgi:hypothetical protein
VAVGRTTNATTHILRQDMKSAEHAAAAGWIHSPARLLPESDDLVHIYRYRPASPGQIGELRAAYHHAITATETVTTTLDSLLTDICAPGEPYALARALQRNPLAAPPQSPISRPVPSQLTAGSRPGAGDIERLLHDLKVTDPQLLFRAIALDHATRDLTAEALTKTQQLTRLTEDARYATGCHSAQRRNRSASLAAQDHPTASPGPTSAPSSATAQNSPTGGMSPPSLDAHQQPRHQPPPRQHATPAAR